MGGRIFTLEEVLNMESSVNKGAAVALAGALVGAIGCFGPWSDFWLSSSGMNGDGVLVLALLVIASILTGISLNKTKRGMLIGSGVLFSVAAVIGIVNLLDVVDYGLEWVGWGLWLAIIGSAIGAFGALAGIRNKTQNEQPAA